MVYNAWRSMSVLLLVSAALVGCNNPEKDKKVINPYTGGLPGPNGTANNIPDPRFPPNPNVNSPFPKATNNTPLYDSRGYPIGGAPAGVNPAPSPAPGFNSAF